MVLSIQTWWRHLKTDCDLGVLQQAEPTKTLKNSRCDIWSSSNNRRVGSIDWSYVELMSTNFNRRTSHETSCCELRSSLALWGSESQSFGCVMWNERSTENWSRQTDHGVTGTTRRQSNNQVNGKMHHLRDQNRRGKSNQTWKTY